MRQTVICVNVSLHLHFWPAAFRVCVLMTNTDVVHHWLWCLQVWVWESTCKHNILPERIIYIYTWYGMWHCHKEKNLFIYHKNTKVTFVFWSNLIHVVILTGYYLNHQLTKCLHLPQHNAKCPHISLEAVVVVLEVLRRVPAQGHTLLFKLQTTENVILHRKTDDCLFKPEHHRATNEVFDILKSSDTSEYSVVCILAVLGTLKYTCSWTT